MIILNRTYKVSCQQQCLFKKANNLLVPIFIIAFLIGSCRQHPSAIEINTMEEIKQNAGREVAILGIYKPVYFDQKAGQRGCIGRYKIEVTDSLSVLLLPPYLKESIRPINEVQRLEGKMVKVTGIVADKTYMEAPAINKLPLALLTPSFTVIKSIELME